MRRVICLLLALVLCMALPMAAFAASNSVAESGTPAVTSNPKTGDMARMDIWVPVLIISLVALVALCVIYFRKFSKAN